MDTKKTSLVSGGAGFIGSNLCERLLKTGNEVLCLDNLITGRRRNISSLFNNRRFKFFKYDLTKKLNSRLQKEFSKVKYIYHLASPASPPKYRKYSLETMLVNSYGTLQMLALAQKNDARFLLASTSEVYGNPNIHPQKENYFGNVNPIGPRACYDESKRYAEALTMEYLRKFHTEVRIARIFNTYGPKMDPEDGRVVSNFINQALAGQPLTVYGNGKQTRSFCYIDDLVRGLISLMEGNIGNGEVVNLGNPEELKIIDIAGIILKLCGKKDLRVDYKIKPEDDPDRRKPDITKAKDLIRWTPKIPLSEGLDRTIRYFQDLRKNM